MTPPTEDTIRLPVGTRMHEFEIRDYLGAGGFSIVYLAWDHVLRREVALKEYLPAGIAQRGSQTRVYPRSQDDQDIFQEGLRCFMEEAQMLAQFDHASLVRVLRFWEAHGTAYMVMPFYKGVTLKARLAQRGHPADEAWLLALLDPLTAALQYLHRAQYQHRDIAPDNILLLAEGEQPVLLDFGAARKVVSGYTQDLAVMLKPGYAPIEQYADDPSLRRGPWTDVYALSALVHWALVGRPPPAAVNRVYQDPFEPLSRRFEGKYSPGLLQAVDRGLVQHPDQRLGSIAEWRLLAGLDGPTQPIRGVSRPLPDDDSTVLVKRPKEPHSPPPAPADESTEPTRLQTSASPPPQTETARPPKRAERSGPAPQGNADTRARPARLGLVAAAVAIVTIGGGALAWLTASQPGESPPTRPAASGQPAPAAAKDATTPATPPMESGGMPATVAPMPAPMSTPPPADAGRPANEGAPTASPTPVRPREMPKEPEARPAARPPPAGAPKQPPSEPTAAKDKPPASAASAQECARLIALESLGQIDAEQRARLEKVCARR